MGRRVVLVEDEDPLRTILARGLARRGHTVRAARTGAEARELLAAELPDVVVIDINLPDETGWDVLRWLRGRDTPPPRIVVITAAMPPRDRVAALQPEGVLTKPFPIDALLRFVEGPSVSDADVR